MDEHLARVGGSGIEYLLTDRQQSIRTVTDASGTVEDRITYDPFGKTFETDPSVSGRYGWTGGYGTTAYNDPQEGMIGILFTQRAMESPEPPKVFTDFWTLAYGAME